jgi:hypothetical protein
MPEHRRSPRYRICRMVRLDFGHEGAVHAETLNYSDEGLLCRTRDPLPLGTKLAVLLDMEEGGLRIPFQVEARVVRLIDTEGPDRQIALELVEPTEEGSRRMVKLFEKAASACQEE